MSLTWILEQEIFEDHHKRLENAAKSAGHQVVLWDDNWWKNKGWPSFNEKAVVFHGSLGNADKIATELPWQPGAICSTSWFSCCNWYPQAESWLIHKKWVFSSVSEFVDKPEKFLSKIGSPQSFFVRPNSPLKPFSGRVLQREKLSLQALDYGFYYDDKTIPIVVAPAVEVGAEWRFVISQQNLVTSSSYQTLGRKETHIDIPTKIQTFAQEIASKLLPPDPIYILDICIVGGSPRLLELNPFSGADLYACDRFKIVKCVENLYVRRFNYD